MKKIVVDAGSSKIFSLRVSLSKSIAIPIAWPPEKTNASLTVSKRTLQLASIVKHIAMTAIMQENPPKIVNMQRIVPTCPILKA